MDLGFRFLSGIGLRNVVLGKLAFKPPATQNYEIIKENGKLKMMTLSDPKNDESAKVPAETYLNGLEHISVDIYEVQKDIEGEHVNLVHLKNSQNPN
jgi:hypothetical protein